MEFYRVMTRLILVRHGETEWNKKGLIQGGTDVPLNATGRVQALAVVDSLQNITHSAIVSSPLARAAETARIIADALHHSEISFEDDLVEQGHGEAEGTPWASLEDRFPNGKIPGFEPHTTLAERAFAALSRVAERHPSGTVIVVTHGALINAMTFRAVQLPELYPGSVGNCSIRDLSMIGGELGVWSN